LILFSFVSNALALTPTSLCLVLSVACLVLGLAGKTPMLDRYAAHIQYVTEFAVGGFVEVNVWLSWQACPFFLNILSSVLSMIYLEQKWYIVENRQGDVRHAGRGRQE
jgi:hypothetical protein